MHDSALLRDWKASRVPVYFDFGKSEPNDPLRFEAPTLWRLNPSDGSGSAYLSPVARSYFIEVYLNGVAFDEPFTETLGLFADHHRKRQAPQHRLPSEFNRQRARGRL
jgi:hypothetical protein